MITISDFEVLIEDQLQHNQHKSLFYELANGQVILSPSRNTIDFLINHRHDINQFFEAAKQAGTYDALLKSMANKSMKLFMEVNQYLDFTPKDLSALQRIYDDLLIGLCHLSNNGTMTHDELIHLLNAHYKKLQTFLLISNGTEIFKKYQDSPRLYTVECSEYTPEFQMELFHLDLQQLKAPVLDLGCGSHASFVHFLRANGIEAYGTDRNIEPHDYVFNMNWFEFPFTTNAWGTVISHMAFSNHFTHHHLKADGQFERYARKYMDILHSLKPGGSFYYAPKLPFMEELLMDNPAFVVESHSLSTRILKK